MRNLSLSPSRVSFLYIFRQVGSITADKFDAADTRSNVPIDTPIQTPSPARPSRPHALPARPDPPIRPGQSARRSLSVRTDLPTRQDLPTRPDPHAPADPSVRSGQPTCLDLPSHPDLPPSDRFALSGLSAPPNLPPPSVLSAQATEFQSGPLEPRPMGPPSWPIVRMVVWPGVHTSEHLPLGREFEVNKPRQLSIQVPSYGTPIPAGLIRWEAFPSWIDFSEPEQVSMLNHWRARVIQRAMDEMREWE